MRTFVRLALLSVSLPLLACVALAQPARAEPERTARCREAAIKYVHPSPDKAHLTVEAEEAYEYEQNKKYLRVCGDSDDALTRSVKASVLFHEAGLALDELRKPDSPRAKDPNTYALIAAAFELRYNALLDARSQILVDPLGAESRAKQADYLADQLIDAYARAVAACGTEASCQAKKDDWTQKLTGLYKSRHSGSDAGLEEFIAGALQRPLPNP